MQSLKSLPLTRRGAVADDIGDMNGDLGKAYEHLLGALAAWHGGETASFIRDEASETAIHLMSALGITDAETRDDFGRASGGAVQTALMVALMLKRDLMDSVYRVLPTWVIPHVQETLGSAHICSRYAEEQYMSDCKSGCKVWRCRICRTKAILHSQTYGCQHHKAH